jgi:hypothetical protein
MLFRETVAVDWEDYEKHESTLYGENAEFIGADCPAL